MLNVSETKTSHTWVWDKKQRKEKLTWHLTKWHKMVQKLQP